MSRLVWFGLVLTALAIWLGYNENKLRTEHAKGDSCKKLKLGEENPLFEADLKATMPSLLKTLSQFMDVRAEGKLDDPDPRGKFKRVQHPVAWGCAPATVEITLPPNETDRQGLFSKAATYEAMIRFSKNSFDPDNAPKVASVALKIFGVSGPRVDFQDIDAKVREVNKNTQDLIFISNPTLPLVVVPDELDTLHKYLIWGKLPAVLIYQLLFRPTLIPREIKMLVGGMSISNPLDAKLYTVQPSKLGEQQAIRLGLFPCKDDPVNARDGPRPGKEYVHDTIQAFLDNNDGCMKLMIQKQTDPCTDQVDDILHEWSGQWSHVGYVKLKKGTKLDTGDSCENLSFNPFHALEANRPLGWIARLRREVYAVTSARRLEKNRELAEKSSATRN